MQKDTPKYVVGLAKEFRLNQTNAESILWNKLRNNKLMGLKFRRQQPIGRFIADFYCVQESLVIEVDGRIHENYDNRKYDMIRQDIIKNRNIKILRFKNEEIENDIENVIRSILKTIAPLPSSGEGLG